ncbi:MAG: sn-glycerol-1-phosphate dehydrogenase [Chloroflexia bacterium]|nr:sn-glycerol-1-phosphate dehydrogenase [Chloroflexia bacterium]
MAKASTTRHLVVRPGAMASVHTLVSELFPDTPAVIVADDNTFSVAGKQVVASLAAAGHPLREPIVFPGLPALRPDTRHVASIRARFEAAGKAILPIAVGSGSMNDLTKRAAHEAGLPYISVATAASMDGYTASGAALIHSGVKQTFGCNAPVAVIADLDVLRAAPTPMTASGYGDLLGKVTAGADWIVADALGVEPITPDVWEMVQGPLPAMIAEPARFPAGDPTSIEQLFLGLIMTGLAIQVSGSTRCASGSEHQFSHLWEMRGLEHDGELVSHGFKVGFGSIFSAALYERLLAHDWTTFDIEVAVAKWPSLRQMEADIRAMDDPPALIERALEECRAKHVTANALRERLMMLRYLWPGLKFRLAEQLMSAEGLRDHLTAAECPTDPWQIGLTLDQVRASYAPARRIRRRYTVYDLAYEMGIFDDLVAEAFMSGGFWAS